MTTIGPATEADVAGMVELLGLLFTQEADFAPDPVRQERGVRLILANPEVGQLFVARDGPAVVGMVSLLTTVSTAEGGPVGWIEDLIVRPGRRNEGLGSRLLTAAVDAAKERGLLRVSLTADHDNAAAIRFYHRHGLATSAMIVLRRTLP